MHHYEAKLVDSSRIIADMLVNDIDHDQVKFNEMFDLAMRDEYPLSMRAARIISLCAERYVDLVQPHISAMINSLQQIKVEGVKRGFLKIFAESPVMLNEDETGLLTDMAFNYLSNQQEAIAVRYYCIDILLKVAGQYPEIGNELSSVLNSLPDDSASGLKAKCTQALKVLKRINIHNH
jgi:hypothetical protein